MRKYLVWIPIIGMGFYDLSFENISKPKDGLDKINKTINNIIYHFSCCVILAWIIKYYN